MPLVMSALDRMLTRLGIGNIALGSALLLLPMVLAIGFLTDRERLPGAGISARGGLQASLEAPASPTKG